jgi:tryptophanyl-tRNA synthetase
MTQWKVKPTASSSIIIGNNKFPQSKLELPGSASLEESEARAKLKLGLFSYPVLQAADILVHRYAFKHAYIRIMLTCKQS